MTVDIDSNLAAFLEYRTPQARYASFDYCFNHFQEARESGDTARLADDDHRMLSCLQLGFYLACWGMMRGSGDLLQRSVRDLVPVIEMIAAEPASTWDLDAHRLRTRPGEVLALSRRIRRAFSIPASDTLVTKTMLGVFGCVPAFDRYFRIGFAARPFARTPWCGLAPFTTTTGPELTPIEFSRWTSTADSTPSAATPDRRSST